MSILKELYHGNINQNTKSYIRKSSYAKAMEVLAENEDLLTQMLDGKEKKLFIEYVNAQSTVMGETSVENFIIGFKLGAKIALAMISDDDRIFRDIV